MQPPEEDCRGCGLNLGGFFCGPCRMYDDTDKKQFHCDGCGICRVGGREKFTHCDKCSMCYVRYITSTPTTRNNSHPLTSARLKPSACASTSSSRAILAQNIFLPLSAWETRCWETIIAEKLRRLLRYDHLISHAFFDSTLPHARLCGMHNVVPTPIEC